MCSSIFLAQVIGFWLFLVGLAMVLDQPRFKKTMLETVSDGGLMNWSGFVTLAVGLLIVTSHNLWVAAWPVVITLFGWALILQGLLRLFWPNRFAKIAKRLTAKNGFLIGSWVWLVVGLFLILAGFFS